MNTDIRQRLKSIYDTLTRHFKYRGSESQPVYLTYREPTGRQPPPCRGSTWWRWNWIFLTVAPLRLKSTFTPPVTPETFVYFPPGPFTGSVRNGFTAEFNSNMYFDVIIFFPCIISTHVHQRLYIVVMRRYCSWPSGWRCCMSSTVPCYHSAIFFVWKQRQNTDVQHQHQEHSNIKSSSFSLSR